MEKKIQYKYILDNHPFRLPQKGTKDEYCTSFKDFNITFSFKGKMIDENTAKAIVKFLKEIRQNDMSWPYNKNEHP